MTTRRITNGWGKSITVKPPYTPRIREGAVLAVEIGELNGEWRHSINLTAFEVAELIDALHLTLTQNRSPNGGNDNNGNDQAA